MLQPSAAARKSAGAQHEQLLPQLGDSDQLLGSVRTKLSNALINNVVAEAKPVDFNPQVWQALVRILAEYTSRTYTSIMPLMSVRIYMAMH